MKHDIPADFLDTLWKEDFFKSFLKKQEIKDILFICNNEIKENGGKLNDTTKDFVNGLYFLIKDDPTSSFTLAKLNKPIKFKKKTYSYTQIYIVHTWDDKSKIDFSLREDKVEEIQKIILEEYKRTFPERFESLLIERRDYGGNQIEKITMEILSRKLDYIGNCKDLGKKNMPWDATEFAQIEEKGKQIKREEFLKLVNFVPEDLKKKNLVYYKNKEVVWAYDELKDLHYIFN